MGFKVKLSFQTLKNEKNGDVFIVIPKCLASSLSSRFTLGRWTTSCTVKKKEKRELKGEKKIKGIN